MIVVCENCHHPIWANDAQAHWVHRAEGVNARDGFLHCSTFAPTLPASATATFGIQVWETEDPTLVIEGTDDRAVALKIATRMYQEVVGDIPEHLTEAIEDAAPVWINRDHPAYESESWPAGVTSPEERDGDTPALWYGW